MTIKPGLCLVKNIQFCVQTIVCGGISVAVATLCRAPIRLVHSFWTLVKKHRLAKRLSQEALAEKADVHPTYVGLVERGQRVPGLEAVERISGALGMKLSNLIAEAERTTLPKARHSKG
jgi:ribosome-binding protein aMBF1 (putative translation factor)